ncbi:hypothetical protein BD410DRAFT_835006 [Rickenella mellea]|uniref:Uncharacterized protein n=1 Tax=Rickenella mellea TaxID=50990 RepID=A0A4Y7QLJ0_9AGAM|nr:hypothetical protein BD410DRAFT_835006 [Rickenella mellea]
MAVMLRGLRVKRFQAGFQQFGQLIIIKSFILRVKQYRHDILENPGFVVQTMRNLIYEEEDPILSTPLRAKFSVNDVDQETQELFIDAIKETITPLRSVHYFPFRAVEPLIILLHELENPTSIMSAINAIENNKWLLENGFPLALIVKILHAKLRPQVERAAGELPAYTPRK